MALFDSVLKTADDHFQLGEKGAPLLNALVSLIESEGLVTFLNRFRRAGLGLVADSWVDAGANTGLSPHQLEDGLGKETLQNLARQTGIPIETAAPAVAAMIPQVVDLMTPDGVLRASQSLPRRTDDRDDAIMTAATGENANASVSSGGASLLRAILPLILLAFLVGIGFYTCRPNQETRLAQVHKNDNVSTNNNRTAANSATNVAAPKVDPRVSIRAENGKYFVSGTVSSEAERNQIIEAMRRELGAEAVDFSGLRIDANAKPANWLAKIGELLPALKGWTGGELTFAGENNLRASGNLPQNLIDRIKTVFIGWQLPAIFLGTGADATRAANEQAAAALESAQTPADVVEALNISIINFASGKSDIPPDASPILEKAAGILKNAPAGTNIEVGGHTDNQGNAATNQTLSEARAAAVKSELARLGVKPEILSAKGYGATKSKADNSTEHGRFQNRRIEYTLIGGAAAPTETGATNTGASAPHNTNGNTSSH
jgi:outer membrane protein OmpA-like peptidoglycan-associated protein/uncharacterized protein YidB (DUF937 family)